LTLLGDEFVVSAGAVAPFAAPDFAPRVEKVNEEAEVVAQSAPSDFATRAEELEVEMREDAVGWP
jgi:hypothetical protein